jgi:hypothetical protein
MTLPDVPALFPSHLVDARVYADRSDMIRALVPQGGTVAEVGVALGDFSVFLLDTLEPSSFVAVDTFVLDQLDTMWDRPTAEIFGGLSHAEFYRRRLAAYSYRVSLRVEEGLSWEGLSRCPDAGFDLVYVDAGHDEDCVQRDLDVAVRKVRSDGLVICNDYVLTDHLGAPYGVVQGVNRLVTTSDWRVVGLALHPQMYCDIALRRVAPSAAAVEPASDGA